MAKKKLYVLSVYCPDVEFYPYHPFVATSIYDGIKQYIKFINNRERVCPNPQLHLIGHCEDVNGCLKNVQPLLAPQEVVLSKNFLSWTMVNLYSLSLKLVDYLNKLKETK